ncbi:MAG: hypothetical protein LBN30_01000 [Oscillospiraceae bacterium]|jgi:hypothetical protein|nr:hypothetical protein [Oscillospiraceae bacterium]
MKKPRSSKRRVKPLYIAAALLLIVGLAAAYFLAFTETGYLLTLKSRGFTRQVFGVYVDDDYDGNARAIGIMLLDAKTRINKFWGRTKSSPMVVFSDDADKLKKLGLEGGTARTVTFTLNGAHSYTIISPEGLNVDVIAHELSHAELHYRLYDGKLLPSARVPVWFDEGVATQVDYREIYNNDAWELVTDGGRNVADFDKLAAAGFYDPEPEVRRYNYIISRHEVGAWIAARDDGALAALLDGVNAGKAFADLY